MQKWAAMIEWSQVAVKAYHQQLLLEKFVQQTISSFAFVALAALGILILDDSAMSVAMIQNCKIRKGDI